MTRSSGSRSAIELLQPFLQGVVATEHAEARLHRFLHEGADLAGLVTALAVADPVEARQRGLLRLAVRLAHTRSRLDELRRAQRCRPPEDDQIEQAVGAEPIGAMHRDARRLADRHQTRHDRLRVVLGRTDDLGLDVGRNAAHHVMHGRNDRDRLLVRVDAGEGARRLDDAGQALIEHIRGQVLEMQVDVILLLADPAALADLDRLGAADHVARGQILLARRVLGHEPLALAVGQIAAFAARAFRDQDARAVDAGRMELDELHVLQRQPGAQHHGAAVARAGMRGGAGLVHASAPARRDDGHVGAEAVDRSVLQAPGEQAATGAVLVHQQVESEILDEESRLVLEALLIERVQDGVAGAIRRGAGPIGHVALGILGRVAAEPPLVDLAGVGAAERHAQMLELDDRVDRLAAHIRDRVLVPEPVGAPDRVEHVPAPVVLLDIAERGADSALRGDRVAARRDRPW